MGQNSATVSPEHDISISWCLVFISANLPFIHFSSYFLAVPILPAAFLVFCIYLFYHTNIKSPFLIHQYLCYLVNQPPLSLLSYSLHRGGCPLLTQDAPLSQRLSSSVVYLKENYRFPGYAVGKVCGAFTFFCIYHSGCNNTSMYTKVQPTSTQFFLLN